jgi:hypothetical protein
VRLTNYCLQIQLLKETLPELQQSLAVRQRFGRALCVTSIAFTNNGDITAKERFLGVLILGISVK